MVINNAGRFGGGMVQIWFSYIDLVKIIIALFFIFMIICMVQWDAV